MTFKTCPPLLQRQLRNNAYFSPRHQLLYIATPKVACTGLKWWFAELLGVREAMEQATVSLESDPELVIHDTFARVAPEYTGANEKGLAEALGSPDYFRFCVVRNPYTRVFSAWQSKWLLREPLQGDAYREAQDDRGIESAADIRAAFEAFLRVLAAVDDPASHDVHVAPQAALLDPQRVSYQMVGQIESPSALVEALAARGGPGFRNPLAGDRANVSLLPYSAAWISDEAAELIRTIYARDFELFGYDTAVPLGANALPDTALAVALRSIKLLRGRNKRIGEMIGRLAAMPAAPSASLPPPSMVQVFWAENRDGAAIPYAEKRSAFDVYPPDGQRRSIRLALPSTQVSVARLRLDPANQPVAILLHALSIETAEGAVLWRWSGGREAFSNAMGLAFRDRPGGLMAVCLNDDPQFNVAIPDAALGQIGPGASITVEMTPWPLLDVLPELLAEPVPSPAASVPAPVASTALAPVGLTRELVEVAQLMKTQIQRRNDTIARQRDELAAVQARQRALEAQVVRAEAQLEVLKEFVLSAFGRANERI